TLQGHTGFVKSVAFSPDGTRIVTGSYDNTAKVWDAKMGMTVLDLKLTSPVSGVAISPDGSWIVTGGGEPNKPGEAKVWDAKTGAEMDEPKGLTSGTLSGRSSVAMSVAFSPDGTRIVTGSWDQTARVWDARSGTPLLDLKGHSYVQNSGVMSVAFS